MKNSVYKICFSISVLILIVSIFFYQFCFVAGDSMNPTFNDGDLILIEKSFVKYERMDIVVAKSDSGLLIKRIVGLPGEEVRMENGKVLINGKEIEDVGIGETTPGTTGNVIQLGEDEYFLLGDNRGDSKDSRDEDIGNIKKENIKGRVIFNFTLA